MCSSFLGHGVDDEQFWDASQNSALKVVPWREHVVLEREFWDASQNSALHKRWCRILMN